MAEINTAEGGGKKHKQGKVRSKKMSTRIDFTPMVDLGFLLITFFMLTTTLSKPQVMEINMPVKEKTPDSTLLKASKAMTIILSEKDKIYYYFGKENPKVEVTGFAPSGIRKILLEKNKSAVDQLKGIKKLFVSHQINEEEYNKRVYAVKSDKQGIMVLIKAEDKSRYKNLVDILDEMQITNIGRYAIMDFEPGEKDLIKKAQDASGI